MGLILDELYSTENHVTASESQRVHCIHMHDHMLCQVWSVWLRVTVLHKIGVFLLTIIHHPTYKAATQSQATRENVIGAKRPGCCRSIR